MGGNTRERATYATKVCPRCGAELYDDMAVCYGCLYDFSRERPAPGAPGGLLPPCPGDGERATSGGDTEDLSLAVRTCGAASQRVGALLRTACVDAWVEMGEDGLLVGRDPGCDVVLHSPAVSRRHLRLTPTSDGMEVCDLEATNPATYRGREVRGLVVVPYGDTVDVCGCLLTMTGPPLTERG